MIHMYLKSLCYTKLKLLTIIIVTWKKGNSNKSNVESWDKSSVCLAHIYKLMVNSVDSDQTAPCFELSYQNLCYLLHILLIGYQTLPQQVILIKTKKKHGEFSFMNKWRKKS